MQLMAAVVHRRGAVAVVAAVALVLCALVGTPGLAKETSGPHYQGTRTCKKCHFKQFKSWKKTAMAKSFEVLKPGERAEAKRKAGLDPAKDYTRDAKCVKCHTTGYGKPGGYAIPAAGDEAAAKVAAKLEGIQCEACHGPGSEYGKLMKDNKDYKRDEILKLGLVVPKADTCLVCHNPESPFAKKGDKFNFEERKNKGTHEHRPLKHEH